MSSGAVRFIDGDHYDQSVVEMEEEDYFAFADDALVIAPFATAIVTPEKYYTRTSGAATATATAHFTDIMRPVANKLVWDDLVWDDLDLGALVGSGTFASVYRAKFRNPSAVLPAAAAAIIATRNGGGGRDRDADDLSGDLLLGEGGCSETDATFCGSSRRSYYSTSSSPAAAASDTTFALKRLSAVALATKQGDSRIAYEGIRFEAHLLSQLLPPHAHIVRMYGMSSDLFEKPESGFLILELLGETLEERLHKWRNLKSMEKEGMTVLASCQKFFDRRRGAGNEQRFRIKRIGLGIAEALRFLHEHRVLYRDLKPANIGFDDTGRVRLFDFDLSRIYKEEHAGKKLTGCIGSLRYMSPECARGLCYGFPSDVHSFAILLWEICTLQRPYTNVHTTQQLAKVAFIGSERPSLRKVASPDIKALLQGGWNPNPDARPSFASVVDVLRSLGACGRKRKK